MFPYVPLALFKLRIGYSAADFELSDADGSAPEGDGSEWDTVLTDILETESERVESWTGERWRGDDESPPAVVKDAVLALAQHSLSQIKERGLEDESLGSGASGSGGSYTYTPTETMREQVKRDLADAGYTDFWSVSVESVGRF